MDIERAINDDRAVSPVIGVILMVAITVILAAVIGTFVLGMSDQMGDTSPRASFTISASAGNVDDLSVTHETGDTIAASQVSIVASEQFTYTQSDGTTAAATGSANWDNFQSASGDVSAGDSVVITSSDGNGFSGSTIRVTYTNPDTESSTTLQKKEIS